MKNKLKLLSYNIDTNIVRTEEGIARDAFPEWRANVRVKPIINTISNIIDDDHPDLIHIQEGRKFITKFGDEVDSVTNLAKALREKGYEVLVQDYNEFGGDTAFKYITAYDPNRLELNSKELKYVSKTPNELTPRSNSDLSKLSENEIKTIKSNNYGAVWEWGIFICDFTDKQTGDNVHSLNLHLNPFRDVRLNACRLITEFSRDIVIKNKDANIVIAGDFNTFMEEGRGGADQIAILTNESFDNIPLLNEVTDLRDPNGEKADFTYASFPCDFGGDAERLIKEQDIENKLKTLSPKSRREKSIETFHKECKAESHLDRILYRGYDKAKIRIKEDHLFEKPSSYDEQTIKTYIVEHAKDGPAFASDHKPLLTTFTKYSDSIIKQKGQTMNSGLNKG